MAQLIYYFLKLISYLPFWVLYAIADLLFFLNFYLIGYRKKLVMDNLNIAFPEKTKKEKEKISQKFFRQFSDFIVESIKNFSMKEEEYQKRYQFENLEEIRDHILKTNKGAVITASHQFNWEWMIYVAVPIPENIQAFISYTPLSNKMLDKLIRKNRERFGLKLASARSFIKTLEHNYKNTNKLTVSGLISDQSPRANYKFRTDFFGVNVPVYTGPESIAKKLDQSFWFLWVEKPKRGHYKVRFDYITDDTNQYETGELTKIFIQKTEELIRFQPENYLWSHRRWKHRREE
ncbi:MAG: lipid A biosynthesis acyltransferase [Bacteroidales bacterium]|nr:lipid A biosynthesis acyltransferase [Bacteroidales bacterium]